MSRIHAYFEENKTTPFLRSESSIMHRWMTILSQVNKFCSCYEQIECRHQSGATIQDKVIIFLFFFISFIGKDKHINKYLYIHLQISDAARLYKGLDQENKAFTLIHCWNKLKDEDKWKAKRRELANQDKKNKNKNKK